MYQTKEKTRENIAITNALIKQNENLIKQLKETNKRLCAERDKQNKLIFIVHLI